MNKLLRKAAGVAITCAVLTACIDDLHYNTPGNTDSEGVALMIPIVESISSGEATRAELSSSEGQINSLRLYIFKKKSSATTNIDTDYEIVNDYNGKDIFEDLEDGSDAASKDLTSYKKYPLSLSKGDYRFYLLGNVDSYIGNTDLTSITTIADLKKLDLQFTGPLSLEYGLPMVCLSAVQVANKIPSSSASADSDVTIDKDSKNIYCDMSFLCSKVRYTILFDNTETGVSKDFKNHVVDFSSVDIANICNNANIANKKESHSDTDFSPNAKAGVINKFSYAPFPTNESEDWSSPKNSWETADANKRAWQGVAYLPENTSLTNKTRLTFTGSCQESATDNTEIYSITKNVELVPQHDSCIENVDGGNHGISRSMLYDIHIKMVSFEGMEVKVTEAPWEYESLLVDFVHTYLELERTSASVTSILDDVMGFDTDGRGEIKLECYNPANLVKKGGTNEKITTPVIILGDVNRENHTLTISANPDLLINEVDEQGYIGTATCYIKAGNITKQILVDYDLNAFFEVMPESVTFNWNDAPIDGSGNKYLPDLHFNFETNLGGIKLYRSNENGDKLGEISTSLNEEAESFNISDEVSILYVDNGDTKTATSTITLNCAKTNTSTGTITVSTSTDCGQVAHHYFYAEPKNQFPDKNFGQLIMVSVIPSQGNYRIYFRAINDYQDEGGKFLGGNWGTYYTEDYTPGTSKDSKSDNWIDWWNGDEGDSGDTYKNNNHYIYMYGQIGETGGGFTSESAWSFNYYDNNDAYNNESNTAYKSYRDRSMNGDYLNPGWYFKDILPSLPACYGNRSETITPGRTLFIFHAKNEPHQVHRCSHHNDPGVPLFNYEDREGWYLYDPTREPYYSVYDDKPAIEDIVYEFYTKGKPTEWYRYYGVASGNSSYDTHTQYKIYGNLYESGSKELGKYYKKSGSDWFVAQVKFKAPKGEYGKNIKISVEESGEQYIYACNETGWANPITPRIHIENDRQQYKPWNDAPEMERMPAGTSPTGGNLDKEWWKFKVPQGFENGKITIYRKEDGNRWAESTFLNNRIGICYLKDNFDTWWEYKSSITSFLTLMGGQSYEPVKENGENVIKAYYLNGQWHQGEPAGY